MTAETNASPSPKCPYCAAPLESGSQVCPACGRWVDPPGEQDKPVISPKKPVDEITSTLRHNRETIRVLAIGAALLGLICCGLAVMVIAINLQTQAREAAAAPSRTALSQIRTATAEYVAVQAVTATQKAQATQAVQATQTAQALQTLYNQALGWPLVLSDTFEMDLNYWYTAEDKEDDLTIGNWQLVEGVYRIQLEAKQGFSQWMWPDVQHDLHDFYLATTLEFHSGPETMEGGLQFRVTEDGGFYLYAIYLDGNYALYQRSTGGWKSLLGKTPTRLVQPDNPNRLELIALGDTFYLFLNGELLDILSDNTLTSGWVGLESGLSKEGDQGVWIFDDFVVRAP